MPIDFPNPIHDAGSIDGTNGARVSGCQFVTPARTGTGVYTLTLSEGIDAGECSIVATCRASAGNSNVQVAQTSDTVKTITCFVAAVATDIDFDFTIMRVGVG